MVSFAFCIWTTVNHVWWACFQKKINVEFWKIVACCWVYKMFDRKVFGLLLTALLISEVTFDNSVFPGVFHQQNCFQLLSFLQLLFVGAYCGLFSKKSTDGSKEAPMKRLSTEQNKSKDMKAVASSPKTKPPSISSSPSFSSFSPFSSVGQYFRSSTLTDVWEVLFEILII